MDPKVEVFLEKTKKWQEEMKLLREFVLDCGLTESFKWMHPCYQHQHKNVVLIHGFKDYCALLFFKGVLLQDSEGILIQQTENVQAARQIRFENRQQIQELKQCIKSYVFEAVELEKLGLEVPLKKTKEFDVPAEFELFLKENTELKTAFEALTPGRQRGYLLYFSQAKQSKTRISRIEKFIPVILNGKGLKDK
ncbi:YdeI family protein [Wenyingzhuangia sp. 2_MG-2023]|uniref:YdeI/OmpD-associated family protein n=1 Tax=Wenyingzhuangia sp. 2_MG-2023 TaxID=3062639 RepID=UPI0026E1D8ED|nr:YdeI family protein [Wenyingzhuangia sp. 2_MG-2023]MDO6738330.1 YdeI family protein [Wenyingzhuangia sp. 2_MG-2023]